MTTTAAPHELLRLKSHMGRLALATTVLGSGMALLDGTIVNVALPTIGRELHADLAGLQWVVNAYALTLAAFILLGGSLGDRFGRRAMYAVGVGGFGCASALCALSPTVEVLIAARAIQGLCAALLVPGSLAILQASFHREDRMAAIGAWTGLLGVATASGPVVGGWLVERNWTWAFWLNVPLAVVVVVLALKFVPESRNPLASKHIDVAGVTLAVVGLAGLTYGLTSLSDGVSAPGLAVGCLGVLALGAFVWAEMHSHDPMVPPSLFANRVFSTINLVTLLVYAGLAAALLFLVLFLQTVAGWSALSAGAATLPLSVVMLAFAGRFGRLAAKSSPRPFMIAGTLVAAGGFVLLAMARRDASYLIDVFPGITLVGVGLAMTVAPLTGTVLAAAPDELAGTASGVNNAVARTAGLLAIAALPPLVGLGGADYASPGALAPAYRLAMLICAALLVGGAALTAFGLADRKTPCADSPHLDVTAR
ncbi:EmrB/QacA subfamily drug resistance transporter [Phycicoccus badiiscoriae]|uniref:EmrB/QacA subfamily drug resistance transporter n=1 Tax=Pedococcus badiiscoriae TaxID=642776 RepID=A0A852WDK0_9MICO|nr:MFS transporter [Pedococcus badiiscoriae]NYG06859.1 EmrB/QacA subfamily drug resistance transporter [Pedococcus badiiscoriae]